MEDDWSLKNPKRVKALNNGDKTKFTKLLTIVTNKQNRETTETVLTSTDETVGFLIHFKLKPSRDSPAFLHLWIQLSLQPSLWLKIANIDSVETFAASPRKCSKDSDMYCVCGYTSLMLMFRLFFIVRLPTPAFPFCIIATNSP